MFRLAPLTTLLATAALVLLHATGAAPAASVNVVRLPPGGVQPQIAVDSTGVRHVLYFQGDPAHGDLFYSRLDSADRLTPPIRVNSEPGSAIATGTMRGGHLAIGRDGRVHVAWHGSSQTSAKAPGNETPVLYSRSNASRTAFDGQRNVVSRHVTGLDAGTVAADAAGNVYVAWHAFEPGRRGEADRRVWVARSHDDGRNFDEERPASDQQTGACGCCAVGATVDRNGVLYVLYRSATDNVHRDTYLLISRDHGATFSSQKLQEWNVAACPMSSFSLTEGPGGMLAAWETDGQVQWTSIDSSTGRPSPFVTAPGATRSRKHPAIAANQRGEILLVWAEGTGWSKGGSAAWQLFDTAGKPIGGEMTSGGVPIWSMTSVASRPEGTFTVVY